MNKIKRIRRIFRNAALLITSATMAMPPVEAFQGRGGGGGRPGGGGGGAARPSGGGGGMARPQGGGGGGMARPQGGGGGFSGGGFRGMSAPAGQARPSMPAAQARPSMPNMQARPSMPNNNMARPSMPNQAARPSAPNMPANRPATAPGNLGGAARPNSPGNMAGMARPTSPGQTARPGGMIPGNPGGGNMPSIGSRPPWANGTGMGGAGAGQRPVSPGAGANRPGAGMNGINRPGGATTLPGNVSGLRPGAGGGTTKPAPGFRPDLGSGTRPGGGGSGINRPGGAATLPGQIGGNRPGAGGGGINRPPGVGGATTLPGNVSGLRPGAGGGGINRPGIGNGIGSGIDRPGFGGGGINRPGGIGNRPGQNGGGINRPGGNTNIIGGNTNNNININNNNVNNRPVYNRPGYNGPGWWNTGGGNGGGYRPGGNGYNNWGGGGAYNRPGSGWWTNRPGGWGYDNGYGGYRPQYWNNHNNWHHGGWGWSNPVINNYYGGYGGYGYNNNWLAWGMGGFGVGLLSSSLLGWGMGSSLYNWGYSSYSNPYYSYMPATTVVVQQPNPVIVQQQPTQMAIAPYDYSKPLNTEASQPPQQVADPALTTFEKARQDYISGNFEGALAGVNKSLEALPNDAVMHEFRGLCLFSLGRYGEASATIYPVLAVQPGMDWTSLSSLYNNVDNFTNQLRKLEGYRDANPDNPAARFLLSYLYLSMGYRDQAKTELTKLVKLQPADTVSAGILRVLNSTDDSGNPIETPPASGAEVAANQPAPAPATGVDAPAIDPAKPAEDPAKNAPAAEMLNGKFTAKPSTTDTITLELTPEKTFKWSVAAGSQAPRGFNGKYEYTDGVLALLSDQNGQRLVGRLTLVAENQFRFQVVDAPPSDQGLLFSK